MKHSLSLPLFFAILATGCKPSPPATPPTPPPTSTQPQAAGAATTPASPAAATAGTVKTTVADLAAKKADFLHVMWAQLNEVNMEINSLDSQATNASKPAKDVIQPKIDVLRAQAQSIKVQLNHVDDISESGWDNFSTGVEKTYGDLKNAIAENRQWVSNYLLNQKAF